MIRRLAAIALLALLSRCAGLCQDTIELNGPSPLGTLAWELARRGYSVTYEEAPYDKADLLADIRPHGARFLYPRSVPMKVQLEGAKAVDGGTGVRTAYWQPEHPTLDGAGLRRIVEQYNNSGNPGRFTLMVDEQGRYVHIVPAGQVVSGKLVEFQPILSTPVQMSPVTNLCTDTLRELFRQLKILRGANVVEGVVPIGNLIRGQCAISGNALTARDVLIQTLQQAWMCCMDRSIRGQFVWGLLYDANVDKYFLSTAMAVVDWNTQSQNPAVQKVEARPAPAPPVAPQIAVPQKREQ